jgi:hypothetical protein
MRENISEKDETFDSVDLGWASRGLAEGTLVTSEWLVTGVARCLAREQQPVQLEHLSHIYKAKVKGRRN